MSNITQRVDQWNNIYPYLQSHPRTYAGQKAEYRLFLEGVLCITRSGAQWCLLLGKDGNWNSDYKRFARWCDHGI